MAYYGLSSGRTAITMLIIILIMQEVAGTKLNVPRVLLPYSNSPPSFILESESGCYTWTSTRPDIVNVQLDDNSQCQSSATIRSRVTSGSKSSAMIMAEDTNSGLLLRADIIVDKIHSLKIVTKTHELYLEETPEKFEVRAYDEHGNEFSTLKGIKFRWTIESGGGNSKGTDILRFMTWKDSPYNTEPILEKLETDGFQGNKVLLEGIKTGSAKVTVRLVDGQHSSVAPAVEPLMVVANLFLVPPAAYLLPCATIQYSANQFKSNKLVPVKLPSANHNLVLDPALGKLESERSARVTASTKPGAGIVELVDRNVAPGDMVKTPTSDLSVVLPVNLELSLLPHKSWTVVAGREVSIAVNIVDKDNNVVYASDNLHISVSVDDAFFSVKETLTNGTMLTGTPLKPGSVTVRASLTGAGTCDLASPITGSVVMEIVPEMSVEPEVTYLAWDPLGVTSYSVQHRVVGGVAQDSDRTRYTWSSSNSSIASTNQAGLTSVDSALLGSTWVTAHLQRYSHCDARASVHIVPAVSLNLVPAQQEFEVGTTLNVPVSMQSSDQPLSHCHSLPVKLTQSDSGFTAGVAPSTGHCASISVRSDKVSHSKLSAAWSYTDEAGRSVTLSDSKYIASYSPLTPVSPVSGETRVALDTERDIAWSGGPGPWPLQPSAHYTSLSVQDESLVSTVAVGDQSLYKWRVKCLAEGETKISLTVGNHPSSSLANPVTVTSSVIVHCAKPHTIQLSPTIAGPTTPNIPPCPLQASLSRLSTQAYLDLKMMVNIKDSKDRVIDSVAGVKVDWRMSDTSLGQLAVGHGVSQDSGDSAPYQVLKVAGRTGDLDISATIARDGGLLGSSSHTATAQLALVEDASIAPDNLDMFVMETGAGQASQGSGYFTVLQDSKEVVSASYVSSNASVRISPVSTGSSSVTLVDMCLSAQQTAKMTVRVLGVHKVMLETRDKVELGGRMTARVKMVDSQLRPLPPSSLQHMTVSLASDRSHVSVASSSSDQFQVSGDSLGQAALTATVSYDGHKISSAPASVTVYPPLVLEPRNISLIIGASFQFTHQGGPADTSIQYSVGHNSMAKTNDDGVVTSLALGSTTMTATCVGSDGTVYSQDTVQVFIRPLSSVQLMVPSHTIVAGSSLPVYLYGQDSDMNVFSYGSALPLLNIDWSISPQSSASIRSPLASVGHGLVSDNNGVVVLTADSPGKVTVSATVSINSRLEESGQHQLERDKSLTISTTITVIERLQITNLDVRSGELLLAPGSSFQLRTNKNSVFSVADNSVVTVTRSGLVRAGSSTGTATILAKHDHDQVSVVVEVRPVHYLLVTAESSDWSGDNIENVPRGGQLRLTVTRHDKWGRVFSGQTRADTVSVRPSRFDFVKTSGLSLETRMRGWTVWQVYDKAAGVGGWMVFKVGEGVAGVGSMTVGDVAQFSSYVSSDGHWESEPAGVLDLDPETGLAVAMRSGHARVRFMSGAGTSVFVRQVSVSSSDIVSIDSRVLGGADSVTVKVVLGAGDTNLLTDTTLPSLSSGQSLFSCDLSWDQEHAINTVFTAAAQWSDSGHWSCVITQVSPGPGHPATVTLSVMGSVQTLRYLPPVSVSHHSVEVGLDSGVCIKVSGHSEVLDMIDTRNSDGLALGSAWLGQDGELNIPVSLTHYTSVQPSVTISVPASGQSIVVSVLPLLSSCNANTGFVSALALELINYYQTVLCIIAVSIVTFYVTKTQLTQLTQGPSKPVAPAPASPSKQTANSNDTSQTPTSPYLWTVDNSPIYGSPIYRRSPPSQPRNLAQYSYN